MPTTRRLLTPPDHGMSFPIFVVQAMGSFQTTCFLFPMTAAPVMVLKRPLGGRAVLGCQAEALGAPCQVAHLAAACGQAVRAAASGQALRPSGAQAAADLLVGQAPLQMC